MSKQVFAAAAAGLVFGLGLGLSQMVNPAKVLGFLSLDASWDPSLALVMGGALVTTFIGYRIAWKRGSPLLGEIFNLPAAAQIDRRLITGAALFGLGWGLVGLCPGPALAALPLATMTGALPKLAGFVAAMIAGILLTGQVMQRRG